MNKIDVLKKQGIPPCAKCALLGHASPNNCQILLTLSPNPRWEGYSELQPDGQHYRLCKVLSNNSSAVRHARKYFKHFDVIGTHFEFAKNGNLHSHSIVEIPIEYHGYERNLVALSKYFHKVVGEAYNNCQISANTKWIKDIDIMIYINKENAYPPVHPNETKMNITNYLIQEIPIDEVDSVRER